MEIFNCTLSQGNKFSQVQQINYNRKKDFTYFHQEKSYNVCGNLIVEERTDIIQI